MKRVEKTKNLGVIIHESLNWDEQFKRVRSKVNTGLMSLKRLKNLLPQGQLCCVYYGLVESHLRYGDIVLGSLNKSNIIALQRLQNRACCTIENAKIKDSCFRSWLNVENIIRYDRDVMTYEIKNKLCPEVFLTNSSQDPRFRNIMHSIVEICRYRDIELNFQNRISLLSLESLE